MRLLRAQLGAATRELGQGALPLARNGAEEQRGQRQHHHQQLKFRRRLSAAIGGEQRADQSDLDDRDTSRGAGEAASHGEDDQRHEQQVEELVSLDRLQAENKCQ